MTVDQFSPDARPVTARFGEPLAVELVELLKLGKEPEARMPDNKLAPLVVLLTVFDIKKYYCL